jgi:hypothetical protein
MLSRFRSSLSLALCAVLSLGLVASCGKKKSDAKGEGDKSGAQNNAGKAGGSPCSEKTELVFTPAEGDGLKLDAPFTVKKTLGYISGMSYSGKSLAKLGYVVFANFEAKIGMYGLDMPKDPKEVALVVSFKNKSEDVEMEKQQELYKSMKVPAGEYAKPGWMDVEQIFQVSYFVGGSNSGPTLSMSEAKGKATLTVSTPEWICGSIDFTSPKGSTVKGTFAVKVEKDMWAK